MPKSRIRHMFPGGNTSLGFYSYYDYILPKEKASRILILKGGPGVGKSTFMKKIANEMENRGYDMEFMHCSSDSESLDGLVIPSIGVAIIDGTAPHVVDPKIPGVIDEIINLGEFWDEAGIRANGEDIIRDSKVKSGMFSRAYRYLKAAAEIYKDTETIYNTALDRERLNTMTYEIIDEIMGDKSISKKEGCQRCLFASAISPKGLINYLDTVLTGKIFNLSGSPGNGTEKILDRVKTAAIERGLFVESFYCALNPHKLEHIVIPELSVSLTTGNKFHFTNKSIYKDINIDDMLDSQIIGKYSDTLRFNENITENLINGAIASIKIAKSFHEKIENYYIPHMDYESVQNCWNKTMERILKYASKTG